MQLHILHPGSLASIQDAGRPAMRRYGVPVGGAADTYSFRLVNLLLHNSPSCAVIETAGGGFRALAQENGVCAWVGPHSVLRVNGAEIASGSTFAVPADSLLEISGKGNYQYLGVAGGWQVPEVLGSRSWCRAGHFGGYAGRALQKGDCIQAFSDKESRLFPSRKCLAPACLMPSGALVTDEGVRIRLMPGPEYHEWPAAALEMLSRHTLRVGTRRDRTGIQLHTDVPLQHPRPGTMWSAGVCPGTVQVPPDGQPFVLLCDAQTTGGYPRIGQVAAADLPVLVQLPAHAPLFFEWTEAATAWLLLRKQEQWLQGLALTLALHADKR